MRVQFRENAVDFIAHHLNTISACERTEETNGQKGYNGTALKIGIALLH